MSLMLKNDSSKKQLQTQQTQASGSQAGQKIGDGDNAREATKDKDNGGVGQEEDEELSNYARYHSLWTIHNYLSNPLQVSTPSELS